MAKQTPDSKQCRIRVQGRVQGVGFRYFVQREATRLRLAGWVRNLPGGEVELVVRGPAESVNEMIARVREGPPLAWVQRANIDWQTPDLSLSTFTIKPTGW